MSSIVIAGDTSGAITLAAPAVAGTNTLTLPAATGTVITTASSGQSIPKAALPTGSVLQVVQGSNGSEESTTSNSYVASSLSVTITPTSASSKILVMVCTAGFNVGNGQGNFTIYRGLTNLGSGNNNAFQIYYNSSGYAVVPLVMNFLDSPATTSATTYRLYFCTNSGGTRTYVGSDNTKQTITAMEIAA